MDVLLDEFESMSSDWDQVSAETVIILKEIIELIKGSVNNNNKKEVASKSNLVLNKWKNLHVTVSKFAKSLEKKFKSETGSSDVLLDKSVDDSRIDELVQECLLHHFYRQGDFVSADMLANEAGIKVDHRLKEPYMKLSGLLDTLRHGHIEESLLWAKSNKGGSKLEFELIRLQFVHLLNNNPTQALILAQKNFPPFTSEFAQEIQTLMGTLAFASRLQTSPYLSYLSQDFLSLACQSLSSAYCTVMRLPQESAFTQCIRLGTSSLPKINRVISLMKERKGVEWSQQNELPVEIELSTELRYHSIFVCPVLRQQTNEENPPMMLPCGHVICQEALSRLSKGNTFVRFKCPYCPHESSASQAIQVYF